MRFLGIDYGKKRIGMALSDEIASLAFPLETVKNSSDAADYITSVCGKNAVDTVIIGESRNFKGKENQIMEDVKAFAEKLRAKKLEVVFEPEIMSTIQAERLQGRADEQKDTIDASAAAIILQSFLDRHKGGGGAEMTDDVTI
jgi:putative Holliday junction resolvase